MPYVFLTFKKIFVIAPLPAVIYFIGVVLFLIAYAIEGDAQPLTVTDNKPLVYQTLSDACLINVNVNIASQQFDREVFEASKKVELKKLCQDCGTSERKAQARKDYEAFLKWSQ